MLVEPVNPEVDGPTKEDDDILKFQNTLCEKEVPK